ncbi:MULTISPECIES: VOC family protein [unclassified Rhodococcus (in: high G+C Gram-positive bacteria)]|uniref:VOC family protein n=1 Tax=unclassified Rhodococcus (in: high G+C Gram-positive bacteria) TaxID=192944 RepID=UPI001595A55A|nr:MULTISPECIES: VOC family protein [unclassified Rhodococcus (in: high G+C Gram-positive bacteria)]
MTVMTETRTTVWPCLRYDDARTAIRFLVDVVGFTEAAVHGEGDRVDHAELRWPEGGGVMLGSVRADGALTGLPAGVGCAYVVTDRPDEIHARVVAAGVTITQPLRDEDYGSRGFTCRDAEGVHWSFGTYAGTQ